MSGAIIAIRGQAISFRANPFLEPAAECVVHHEDGLVVMQDGRILAFGDYGEIRPTLPPATDIVAYEHALILPGFVDAHVHYPQVEVIGSYGEQLLEWLGRYTFPAEAQFADPAHAERIARLFFRELLAGGTTSAAVYCTVHPQSVDAFFAESSRFNTRMVAGKVLMDRNAPPGLLDTAQQGYDESKALIGRWHQRGRQHYAVTPRFAPTSSAAQLKMAGQLLREHDGLFLQTHLAENRAELAWVAELFPERASYLDVYDHAGLVGRRSVLAHGIHLAEQDFCTCHQRGAALAHCPSSNLFLGSGLFDLRAATDARRPVRVGLGTDIGGGTSFSQLRTLGEAYKVAALRADRLDAFRAFYLATRGGAEALHLEDRIGTLAAGLDADLCVLDLKATPLLALRTEACDSLHDLLFTLMTIGDERAVRATWVAGCCVYDSRRPEPFRYPDPA